MERAHYLDYLFGLFDIKWNLTKDVSELEDFYIASFCHPHKWYMHLPNVIKITRKSSAFDKRKMLQYMFDARPFSNDQFCIDTLVKLNPELQRYLILM